MKGKKILKLGNGYLACIFISLILLLTSFSTDFVNADSSRLELNYSFEFKEPTLKETIFKDHVFTKISVSGSMGMGNEIGHPKLPVKFLKILIPAGTEISKIGVIGNEIPVDLNSKNINLEENPLMPYQTPVPIGTDYSEDNSIDFNEDIYNSNIWYPQNIYQIEGMDSSHGYNILSISLNPVLYNPANNEINYFKEMSINIELKETDALNQFYRFDNLEDKEWVENLVINPELTSDYDSYYTNKDTFDYPGGLCNPVDDFDYVIINTEQI